MVYRIENYDGTLEEFVSSYRNMYEVILKSNLSDVEKVESFFGIRKIIKDSVIPLTSNYYEVFMVNPELYKLYYDLLHSIYVQYSFL